MGSLTIDLQDEAVDCWSLGYDEVMPTTGGSNDSKNDSNAIEPTIKSYHLPNSQDSIKISPSVDEGSVKNDESNFGTLKKHQSHRNIIGNHDQIQDQSKSQPLYLQRYVLIPSHKKFGKLENIHWKALHQSVSHPTIPSNPHPKVISFENMTGQCQKWEPLSSSSNHRTSISYKLSSNLPLKSPHSSIGQAQQDERRFFITNNQEKSFLNISSYNEQRKMSDDQSSVHEKSRTESSPNTIKHDSHERNHRTSIKRRSRNTVSEQADLGGFRTSAHSDYKRCKSTPKMLNRPYCSASAVMNRKSPDDSSQRSSSLPNIFDEIMTESDVTSWDTGPSTPTSDFISFGVEKNEDS